MTRSTVYNNQRHVSCGCLTPSHLQARDEVDTATEGGGEGVRGQAEGSKEGREVGEERVPRPLLAHNHTGAEAREVHTLGLERGEG